jgi:hypothetical protein
MHADGEQAVEGEAGGEVDAVHSCDVRIGVLVVLRCGVGEEVGLVVGLPTKRLVAPL